ncbi:MAG: AAA family ATPase [Ktedonobacteraceae bacterium]
MSRPLLIIVTGSPGAGKTTLGNHIAAEFHLPFIYKDGIKETLFDALGWQDRAWSRKLGLASYELLYYFLEVLLQANTSFIVESNFDPQYSTAAFLALKKKYDFEPLQILCHADGHILWERFKQRAESGERHPGHVETLNYAEFEPYLLHSQHDFMNIGGTRLEVDTTDFEGVDYQKLFKAIDAAKK